MFCFLTGRLHRSFQDRNKSNVPTASVPLSLYDGESNDPSIKKVAGAAFLFLPLELRQHICSLLYHDIPSRRDPCFMEWSQGCRCGKSLSLVNRQLYQETRPLYYRYRKFSFKNPRNCLRFLDEIGDQFANDIGSLAIRCSIQDSPTCLSDIFGRFRESRRLHSVRLEFVSIIIAPSTGGLSLAYMPHANSATIYDLSLRTCSHPLANLKALRSLIVVGIPPTEIEEAIFKAVKNIESIAQEEGNVMRKSHVLGRAQFRIAPPNAP